jgi:hypothetical protein
MTDLNKARSALLFLSLAAILPAQTKIDVSSFSVAAQRGSQLKQTFYALNDPSCPITLKAFAVVPGLDGTRIVYGPSGTLTAAVPVAAVEVRVLLFDVFGEHIKTVNYTEVKPMTGEVRTGSGKYWPLTDHDKEVLLTSIAFVSRVRTDDGKIWRFDEAAIRSEIDKIEADVKPDALNLSK